MNTENAIDIYTYTDPSLFLRDQWILKKKKNESFSIRAWALNLGMKSHSQLHEMLYGKRAIPKKYIPNLIKNLGLNKKEAEYFESILNIQQSKSGEEKAFHYEKFRHLAKKEKIIFEEIEEYEMIRNPLHYFLLELFQLKKTAWKLEDIKHKLYFNYSNLEIKRALETLLKLGLLIETGPGIYKKTKTHFYTKNDIPSEAIREHHKKMADLSKLAIDSQDVNQREFNATTLNIDAADIKRAKELIREFREKFINEFCDPSKRAQTTYQFNMNFFAVSKTEEPNEKH